MQTELDLERNPAPDDPEPLRLARAFVQGGSGAPTSLPDEVADAMVDILVRRRDSEKLTRLAATAGKDMAKRARRGLHLLRSRGVAVEVPRREPPLIQQAQQKEREPERTSLISLPGGYGIQHVFYVKSGAGGGPLLVIQGTLLEEQGLEDLRLFEPPRKTWRQMVHELSAHEDALFVPVEGAYALWRLFEAGRLAETQGRMLPSDFDRVRPLLNAATRPPRHPAYELVPEEAIAAAAREPGRFADIMQFPETETWYPGKDLIRRAALALAEVDSSQLLVTERQHRDQEAETLRRLQREALSGPWREQLSQRLLDTALVIAQRGDPGKRGRDYLGDAALLVAAAQQVADPQVAPDDVLLARPLFEKLLPGKATKAQPSEGPRASEDSLILMP